MKKYYLLGLVSFILIILLTFYNIICEPIPTWLKVFSIIMATICILNGYTEYINKK